MNVAVPITDDVTLRVRHRAGAGSRPFLLVHGLLSNARLWDEVADHLEAAGHPVYAVDLRGHGASDVPDGGYDTSTAASDLAAVGASLGLSGALVAGHSWGGHIALRLAAEHPNLVAGLGLVDGGWFDFDWATAAGFSVQSAEVAIGRSMNGAVSPEAMRRFLRMVHPKWSQVAIEASLADMRLRPDGLLTPRLSEAQCTSIVRSVVAESSARWLPHVSVPVMLLPAAPDPEWPWAEEFRRSIRDALAVLPRASVKWYPSGGHYLHAEDPERLAGDLLELAGAVGPPK